MSPERVTQRLRILLLWLAAGLCVGSAVELALIGHWEDVVQILPFVLCGLGLIAVIAMLVRPERQTVRLLRIVMGIAFVGSLFGVYEHVEHNIEFALEIRPNAVLGDVILDALGGANPLLAPAILGLAAILGIAATYYHPALATVRAE